MRTGWTKKTAFFLFAGLLAAFTLHSGGTRALALEDQKVIGVITKVKISSDDKSADVTLKSTRGDKELVLHVTNELVLDKLRNEKLAKGMEVRAKFEERNGKNHTTYFRKVAGE